MSLAPAEKDTSPSVLQITDPSGQTRTLLKMTAADAARLSSGNAQVAIPGPQGMFAMPPSMQPMQPMQPMPSMQPMQMQAMPSMHPMQGMQPQYAEMNMGGMYPGQGMYQAPCSKSRCGKSSCKSCSP